MTIFHLLPNFNETNYYLSIVGIVKIEKFQQEKFSLELGGGRV